MMSEDVVELLKTLSVFFGFHKRLPTVPFKPHLSHFMHIEFVLLHILAENNHGVVSLLNFIIFKHVFRTMRIQISIGLIKISSFFTQIICFLGISTSLK